MTGEHQFQPGDLIRITLPGSDEDLHFVISDVRDDGGAETVSLIPDPDKTPTARTVGRSPLESAGVA